MKQSFLYRFAGFLLIYCLNAGAASGQNTFQKIFERPASNDEATFIISLADGYLIAGVARGTGTGSWDGSLIKIDYDGHIVWQKTYGYAGGGLDDFYHVAQTSDGGFLVAGAASGFENGPTDLIMLKTDAVGNPLWQKHVSGSSSNFSEQGNYVTPVSGDCIVSGRAVAQFGSSSFYSGLMCRIDHNGDVVWSQLYSSGAGHTQFFSAPFISGDTLFACGQRDSAGFFARINIATGNLIALQAYDGTGFSNETFHSMVQASNGDFLLAGGVGDNSDQQQWVCRVSRNGALKWSKIYSGIGRGKIVSLSNDHFLLVTVPTNIGSNLFDPILVKIDGNGEIVWSEKYGNPGADLFQSALETPDGGILAVGSIRPLNNNNFFPVTLVVKTDKNGRVSGCCRQPIQVTAMPYQVSSFPSGFTQSTPFSPQDFSLIVDPNTLSEQDYCPSAPPEQVFEQVFICPGDSIVIGGAAYFAPGTVSSLIPGTPCDTLVTYNIQYTDTGGASSIDIHCPPDKVVVAAPGASSAVVQYDMPTAQSDCACPEITIMQTLGAPGGSVFAVGDHNICFQAQDDCSNSTACCFQIRVTEEENACDVKTDGCVKFELLRITRDADWHRTYHIRTTNYCAQSLTYAAFQVPDGVTAEAPGNNTTYTAPGGRQYMVRNPNFSPFYSIRFTAQGTDMKDGSSDVFRFTLPPQSAPDYIYGMIKTGTQTYSAAHLNTFNCPVEFDPDAQRPAEERSAEGANDEILLFPNPTEGVVFVDLRGLSGPSAGISIFDVCGNLLLAKQTEVYDQTLRIDLPPGMASGLYLFKAIDSAGHRRIKRFVVR